MIFHLTPGKSFNLECKKSESSDNYSDDRGRTGKQHIILTFMTLTL